jgi:hypothetical protein
MTSIDDRVSDQAWFDTLPETERRYPVLVQHTETRVIWVDADSHAAAVREVASWEDYDQWSSADPVDIGSGLEVGDDIIHAVYLNDVWQDDQGPHERCPECGVVALYNYGHALDFAAHPGSCSRHRHSVRLTAAWTRSEAGKRMEQVGWWLSCSCNEDGLRDDVIRDAVAGDDGAPPVLTRDEAEAAARAHVEGRPHGKNFTLGITEDLDHPNPRGVGTRRVNAAAVETVDVQGGVL